MKESLMNFYFLIFFDILNGILYMVNIFINNII